MTYAQLPRRPWLNLPGLVAVVVLHVVAIYAFMHVMGIAIVTPRLPTMVRMIPDAPPPVPEPPKVTEPELNMPTIVVPRIRIDLPPAVQLPHAPAATSNVPASPQAQGQVAPAPATDHVFLPSQVISGDRAPAYPETYADSAHSGRVVVDCMIETTGQPTACRVVSSSGGAAFADETLRWLSGPSHPVYKPGTRDGHALREEHKWVISFEAPQ